MWMRDTVMAVLMTFKTSWQKTCKRALNKCPSNVIWTSISNPMFLSSKRIASIIEAIASAWAICSFPKGFSVLLHPFCSIIQKNINKFLNVEYKRQKNGQLANVKREIRSRNGHLKGRIQKFASDCWNIVRSPANETLQIQFRMEVRLTVLPHHVNVQPSRHVYSVKVNVSSPTEEDEQRKRSIVNKDAECNRPPREHFTLPFCFFKEAFGVVTEPTVHVLF